MLRLREEENVFTCKSTEEMLISRMVRKGEADFGGSGFPVIELVAIYGSEVEMVYGHLQENFAQ